MNNQHGRMLHLGIYIAAGMALISAGVAVIAFIPLDPAFVRALEILLGFILLAGAVTFLLIFKRAAPSDLSTSYPSLSIDPILTEERMRLALEAAHIAIWDWDVPNCTQIVNSAWYDILGYPDQNLPTDFQKWTDRIHPDDVERVMAAVTAHFDGSTPLFEMEYRLKTGAGSWKWVLSRGQVISRALNGDPLRMLGTYRDIDERRAAEEDLRRRDAILDAVRLSAESLLTVPSWRLVLPDILACLGQAASASRVFVYEMDEMNPGELLAHQVGMWTAPGVASGESQTISIRQAGLERWPAALSASHILQGTVASFPEGERPFLTARGVRSLMMVPIRTGEHAWGVLGFDDCLTERAWQPVEQDALRVAANMLAAAIQRQRQLEAEREERRVAEELREITIVLSKSLNYDSILDRLLEQAPRVVPYDGANIMLVRGNSAYAARQRGYELASPAFARSAVGASFSIRETPNLQRVMEIRQPLITPDVLREPGWIQMENYPYRCWIGSSLILEGRVDAILALEKVEPDFYTSTHAARLSLFAGQASLALHNAQLFAESLEALEREQKLSEITRAISSELDLSVILSSVVRLAVELTEAEAGSMAILSADNQTIAYPYLYNLPQELNSMVSQPREGLAWEMIYNHRSLLLADYAADPRALPLLAAAGLHGFIGVPVIVGSSCLGTLAVFSYDPERHFEAHDQALVELVGRQAGVAIRNASLFEAAQNRAVEAETLRQAASAVNSALEISEVLDQILKQLATVIPYDSAAIFLVEEDCIRMRAGRGLANLSNLLEEKYAREDTLFTTIDETNRPLILNDAQADPRFEQWNPADEAIHGWIGLPLRVREDKIGFLTIDSHRVGAYQNSDAELAQAFADEVAIAIENARLFQQVQLLAITDPLTGLYNRRYFFEAAYREFERARRYSTPLSIILIDLDLFKRVNDTYGHLAGDRVLVAIAARCRAALREVDVPARYGGEEFIFLLPQTDLDGAYLLAERLRTDIVERDIESGSQHIHVSASLGIAQLDPYCDDVQSLIHHADLALYKTKNTERGRITVWDEAK